MEAYAPKLLNPPFFQTVYGVFRQSISVALALKAALDSKPLDMGTGIRRLKS